MEIFKHSRWNFQNISTKNKGNPCLKFQITKSKYYVAMYEDLGMNDTVNDKNGFEFQSPKYADTCHAKQAVGMCQFCTFVIL